MVDSGKGAEELVAEMDLGAVDNLEALEVVAKKVIDENPEPVARYRSGKQGVLGFLLGQCMKELRGKGDPNAVKKALLRFL